MAEFYRKKIGGRMEMDRFPLDLLRCRFEEYSELYMLLIFQGYNGFYFRTEPGIPKIARR